MEEKEWGARWQKGYELVNNSEQSHLMFIYDDGNMGEDDCCEGVVFSTDEFEDQYLKADSEEWDKQYPNTKYFKVKMGYEISGETKFVNFVVDQDGNEGILVNDWTKREYSNYPFPWQANSVFIPLDALDKLRSWSKK